MSAGIARFIAERTAEAEAAKIIGEAIEQARKVLKAAKVADPDDVLSQIWDADTPE
jgi:hypothetical protein